jgi:sigma-B regulation protein RsbU (phosphoserine phosphatase)
VVAGTDGIWETADPSGELYGKDRLRAIIAREREGTAKEIGDAIIDALDRFRESKRPLDDVTLIVWKRRS